MAIKTNKTTTKSKIAKIQQIYGAETGSATLAEASAYLNSKGFKSLGDLLLPAK